MREVKWQWDWGVYAPFCPYCNETAYEEDHCVFCKKEYKWVDKSKSRKVTVGEYTVVQASNNHIQIIKDGRMVFHASCTKQQSEEELKEYIAFYERLIGKGADNEQSR